MPDFGGKTVIVTGASTGIGRATAAAFRESGARVVVAARSSEDLKRLSVELGGPDRVLPVAADVADPAQCQALICRTVEHFGGIDVLVNNAGMVVSGKFEYLQPGDIERLFNVNFFGVIYCTRAALPFLKESEGVIVNVSSIAGFVGTATTSAYAASKAALNSLGQSLRVELKPYGIGVSTVCPYFTSGVELAKKGIMREGTLHRVDGPRRRAPGTQTTEEVAHAIVRAAERRSRLVVLSPAGRLIWRANRLFPWLADYVMDKLINGRLREQIG